MAGATAQGLPPPSGAHLSPAGSPLLAGLAPGWCHLEDGRQQRASDLTGSHTEEPHPDRHSAVSDL